MKKIFILDLDGTLYYQFPVRMMMVIELCFYYLFHLSNLKELRILLAYRKAHENIVFDLNQFAKKYSCSPEKIQKIVQYWMQERPLKWISFFADKKLTKKTLLLSHGSSFYYTFFKMKENVDLAINYSMLYEDKNKQYTAVYYVKKGSSFLTPYEKAPHASLLNYDLIYIIPDNLLDDILELFLSKNFMCKHYPTKTDNVLTIQECTRISDQ